jgi:hypothetical protein
MKWTMVYYEDWFLLVLRGPLGLQVLTFTYTASCGGNVAHCQTDRSWVTWVGLVPSLRILYSDVRRQMADTSRLAGRIEIYVPIRFAGTPMSLLWQENDSLGDLEHPSNSWSRK